MIGRLAGRSFGAPLASKPSSTWGDPSPGSTFGNGSSSFSRPCSTSCIAATDVIALVIDAIRKTVSSVIGALSSSDRGPNAPS